MKMSVISEKHFEFSWREEKSIWQRKNCEKFIISWKEFLIFKGSYSLRCFTKKLFIKIGKRYNCRLFSRNKFPSNELCFPLTRSWKIVCFWKGRKKLIYIPIATVNRNLPEFVCGGYLPNLFFSTFSVIFLMEKCSTFLLL